MGAHSFEETSYGATAQEAFDEAVERANYDEGHNCYNGTISTNDDFIMKPLRTDEKIHEWCQRMTDEDDVRKWGPCACVKDPDVEEENGRWLWHFAGWAAC